MSIDLARYPQTPFRQTPIAWPVALFNPSSQKACAVVLNFDWTIYFALMSAQVGATLAANIAVQVDLNSGGTSQGPTIEKIVSVKIDNSNSLNSILVHFPDSGDTISCPPQTIVTLPAVTNGSNCYVIAQGLATGFLPLTKVTFYNYFVPPSVDPVIQLTYPQWLGSPTIQRNSQLILTPGYGSPALGDQQQSFTNNIFGGAPVSSAIFGTPSIGFVYLTHLNANVTGLEVGGAGVTSAVRVGIFNTAGDNLFNWQLNFISGVYKNNIFTLCSLSSMNIKLDATKSWRVGVIAPDANVTAGVMNLNVAFSTNSM